MRSRFLSVAAALAWALLTALVVASCRHDASGSSPSDASAAPARTIRHFAGETKIVGVPQRVVAFGPLAIESLVAIGVRPVGITEFGSGGAMQPLQHRPPYLRAELADVPTLGGYAQPNLEAALALAPDLIVCTDEHMPNYERIAGIAPTILLDQSNDASAKEDRAWRRALLLLGDVFERRDEALRRIAEYDAKVARARESLHAAVGDDTVLVVRMMAKGFRVSGRSHLTTGHLLYDDLGLRPPPTADDRWEAEYVPLERLAALDPDWVLLVEGSDALAKELLAEPVWRNLKAVRGGRVRTVSFFWIRGHGWYGKTAIVDEALRALAGRD